MNMKVELLEKANELCDKIHLTKVYINDLERAINSRNINNFLSFEFSDDEDSDVDDQYIFDDSLLDIKKLLNNELNRKKAILEMLNIEFESL